MPTLSQKLKDAENILRRHGITNPRRDAMSLAMLATGKDKTFVYAQPEYVLTSEEGAVFDAFLERRTSHEPIQYISGIQEFYGLDFEVTPDVLIPRPETEMIVEKALEVLVQSDNSTVCDVGLGSGCIAISILHEQTRVRAVGLDLSPPALEVARRNAEKHGVEARLKLLQSDLFSSLSGEKFDVIVSNPPYIPTRDMSGLQPDVRDFEPHMALTDNSGGLSIISRIVQNSPKFLVRNGHLLLEIGFGQSEEVVEMFDNKLWDRPDVFPDLQGIPRVVSARMR